MIPFGYGNQKRANVQPVDGYYLYTTGAAVHPLRALNENTTWSQAWLPLYVASGALGPFVNDSLFRPRAGWSKATHLLGLLTEFIAEADKPETKNEAIGAWNAYRITNALSEFETVLQAELGLTPLFLVTPKRGYDLWALISAGEALFPPNMAQKVPDAIADAALGMRCLAFELPTAAAFHFHRLNESVLRKYWEAILPGRPHPGNKTVSDYLRALGKSRKGSPKVKAALRDIRDLYRNPVIHPEYILKNVDEALAVFGSIHAAVVQMLDAIPLPKP
jgi:hypothetical protein